MQKSFDNHFLSFRRKPVSSLAQATSGEFSYFLMPVFTGMTAFLSFAEISVYDISPADLAEKYNVAAKG